MKKIIMTLLTIAISAVAFAHPGHGNENPLSPGHYVGNPVHSLPLALAIVVGLILINRLAYRIRKRTDRK